MIPLFFFALRERLCGFINSAAETAGLSQEKDLTLQHRMW